MFTNLELVFSSEIGPLLCGTFDGKSVFRGTVGLGAVAATCVGVDANTTEPPSEPCNSTNNETNNLQLTYDYKHANCFEFFKRFISRIIIMIYARKRCYPPYHWIFELMNIHELSVFNIFNIRGYLRNAWILVWVLGRILFEYLLNGSHSMELLMFNVSKQLQALFTQFHRILLHCLIYVVFFNEIVR